MTAIRRLAAEAADKRAARSRDSEPTRHANTQRQTRIALVHRPKHIAGRNHRSSDPNIDRTRAFADQVDDDPAAVALLDVLELQSRGFFAAQAAAEHDGEQGDRVAGERMTAQAVFNTVKAYAAAIGMDHFAPHDLRRSYAKLAHKGRAPLEQIQLSLGHSSIQTTERYLGVEQDFTDAPCDHLGLRISKG